MHENQTTRLGLGLKQILGKGCFLLLSLLSGFTWADHSNRIQQVRIDGSTITLYGDFPDLAETRLFFGAENAPYRLEPDITKSSFRAIELQLPFQPVPGRYKLTIQTSGEADLELVVTIDDAGVSVLAPDSIEEVAEGAAEVANADNTAPPEVITSCRGSAEICDSPALMEVDSPFCSAVADFDPYRGSQAITIDGTQELYLDEAYTIEARIFTKGYVRSGILVDKYSGNGRGREYRLSVNREGLLRGWFSVDGTLNNIRVLYSRSPVPENEWVHVAATFDGQFMRLFIAGEMVAEQGMRGRPAQLGYQNIAIGGNNCCDGYYEVFNGLIDEVRISSTTRYQESFTPPSEPFKPDSATLLLVPFDEGGKNFGLVGGAAELTDFNRIVHCADL